MDINTDIFRIETNHVIPAQGKVLISEPFLCDQMFGRSVILLIEHTKEGTMGLILNKPMPLKLHDVLQDCYCRDDIPLYQGGPLSTDTLFYLHTLEDIPDALPVAKGLYLNGDFNAIKTFIQEGNDTRGRIRFFLGYSGWEYEQLHQEISENTWMVGTGNVTSLMNEPADKKMWKRALGQLGDKYKMWARFPQIPTLN